MAVYQWGSRPRGVPAQIVGERLAQLADENGQRLTPRVVVEAARPMDAVLHPCFEWDDLRAAELFREDQARGIIRGVRVVTQEQSATQAEASERVFVNIVEQIGEELQHTYAPVPVVRRDPVLRQQVLAAARRDLMTWRNRYLELIRTLNLSESVDVINLSLSDTRESEHLTA